jgi:hypothetical protein
MKRLMAILLCGYSFFSLANSLPAATRDDAQVAGGCAACGASLLVLIVVIIALNIALLIWVARDAKNRGMDNSVIWMILVMVTGLLGLIIYLLSRPKGNLVECASCKGKRLAVTPKCPHCGNA